MKNESTNEISYSEMYIGILDCVENNEIYLKDAYEIDGNENWHIYDEFKKLDVSKEDPSIKEFPHIKLEFVDSIFASKLKLTLEQAWNVWSDPRDVFKTQTHQKIQEIFGSIVETFSEKSEPVFLDMNAKKLSLKEIHEIESINGKPISLIAVTRNQYDTNNFPKYEKYVKEYGNKKFYYGLWPDKKENKVEYDVLYAIPTNNNNEVLKHLNSHNHMNKGNSQAMALVIFSDGSSEIIENSDC